MIFALSLEITIKIYFRVTVSQRCSQKQLFTAIIAYQIADLIVSNWDHFMRKYKVSKLFQNSKKF